MSVFRRPSEAIGLFIDGQQIQAAHLRARGSRVVLAGLEMATLVHPLRMDAEEATDGTGDAVDILGLDEPDEIHTEDAEAFVPEEDDETEPATNLEVVNNLLAKFPVRRCRLGVSLLNGCVHFTDILLTEELKGKKLQKHLTDLYREERIIGETDTLDEHHAFVPTRENRGLSILHEDPLEVLGILDELAPFLGKMRIRVIDPFEIALIQMSRLAGHTGPEVTAIVFVGEDHSNLIFTRDGHYLAVSRPINEGFSSPNLLHTISRRILFEQDVSDIPGVDRIVLAGEARTVDAKPFFEKTFPSASVDYMTVDALALPDEDETKSDLVSTFAVSIGLAWKALRPADPAFYPTNFLPRSRQRAQNPLEIAWHGLALIVLLAGSVLLFGIQAQQQGRTIDQLGLSVHLLEEEIAEHTPLVTEVHELQAQITDYRKNFALLDTLSAQKHTWSDRLREISEATRSTGHIWLTRLSTRERGFDLRGDWKEDTAVIPERLALAGVSRKLERVAVLADRLGDGHIAAIEPLQIRDARVHSFRLTTPSWVQATDGRADR